MSERERWVRARGALFGANHWLTARNQLIRDQDEDDFMILDDRNDRTIEQLIQEEINNQEAYRAGKPLSLTGSLGLSRALFLSHALFFTREPFRHWLVMLRMRGDLERESKWMSGWERIKREAARERERGNRERTATIIYPAIIYQSLSSGEKLPGVPVREWERERINQV